MLKRSLVKPSLITLAAICAMSALLFTLHTRSTLAAATSPAPTATPPLQFVWYVNRTLPPNVIAHWREYYQVGLAPYPSDPGVGKQVMLDHWEETNSAGTLVFYHSIATLPDGSLYQDEYGTTSFSVIVRGPAYAPVEGNADTSFWCVSKSAPQRVVGYYPLYVATDVLQHDRFVMTQQPVAKPIPTFSDRFLATTPLRTLAVPRLALSWQTILPDQKVGLPDHVRIEVDRQQRLIVSDIQRFDATGKLVFEQWQSFSAVALYPVTTILPARISQPPGQLTKGC